MTSPSVLIDKASLQLQSHQVFESLSLTFPAQKCHCVLGRSGVGKSSLLAIISNADCLQSGMVSTSSGSDLSQEVAHMFQDDGLLPWLCVLDNVQLGPRLRGEITAETKERAMELLDSVDLAKWSNHCPASLSGGMRQRVALARTLMEERSIVLMDEPFSKLDAITRDELQVLAYKLLYKRTVVLVTHDPAEALRIGDTITVLHSSLPSSTTTFKPRTQPLRAHDDAEVLSLRGALWDAMAADSQSRAEFV